MSVGAASLRCVSKALYRRYRPQDFSEVIGQEHVTGPLMQALRSGRIGHAYLFSGPRGCGKTTSARILARCLNCEQGPTDTPCGECDSCIALATGGSGSVDVIEIDAASHGGVEDARDLREKAAYGPAQSRYKVYIIDEAHMVTPQGFNALLKIVEEPPEHVKFVFATTEPEKVIGTIRSRTHHYPFRLVPPARLQDYLEELCSRENVEVEPGVLSFVVRAGGGSVRDSLSVLDQLMSGSDEAGLTYAGAAALLGFTEGELLDACVDALAAGDGAGVFRQVDRVIETGQDPRRFVEDLLERFRDLIVLAAVSASPDAEAATSAVLRGIPEDQIVRMRQQAGAFGPGQLSYAADVINAGLTEMTGATSPRLQLELLCARLLLPSGAGEQGHAARLDRLERRLDVGGGIAAPIPTGAPAGQGAAPSLEYAAPQNTDAPAAPHSRPRPAQNDARPVGGVQGHGQEQAAQPGVGAAPGRDQHGERPQAGSQHSGPAGAAQDPGSQPGHAAQAPGRDHADQRPAPRQAPQQGQPAQQGPASQGGALQQAQAQPGPAQQEQGARPGPRGGVDTEMIRRNWPDVLQRIFNIRRVTWTFLSEHAQVLDYDGTRLLLGLSTKGLATTFRNGPHSEVVRQALSEALGLDARVEGIPASDAPRGGYTPTAPAGPAPAGPASPAGTSGPAATVGPAGPGGGATAPADRGSATSAPVGSAPQAGRGEDASVDGPGVSGSPRNSGAAARTTADEPGGMNSEQNAPAGPAPTHGRQAAPRGAQGGGAPAYDDLPPLSDDDIPPDEESLPPDTGMRSGRQARPNPASAPGASPDQRSAAPTRERPAGRASTPDSAPGAATSVASEAAATEPGPASGAAAGETADQTTQPKTADPAQVRRAHAGAAQAREALRAARTGHIAQSGGGAAPRSVNHDDDVSADDEDIADSTAVGQPVIASVLGGVVIHEDEG